MAVQALEALHPQLARAILKHLRLKSVLLHHMGWMAKLETK